MPYPQFAHNSRMTPSDPTFRAQTSADEAPRAREAARSRFASIGRIWLACVPLSAGLGLLVLHILIRPLLLSIYTDSGMAAPEQLRFFGEHAGLVGMVIIAATIIAAGAIVLIKPHTLGLAIYAILTGVMLLAIIHLILSLGRGYVDLLESSMQAHL